MANIFDVAAYILEKNGGMTTMKLQKLCYYSQAWSLVWDDMPIFEEDFEAWANGPVCRELFNAHRGIFYLDKDYFSGKGDSNNLTDEQKETINSVLESYGNWEPQELSGLTHSELPWKNARRGFEPGDNCDVIIEKSDMQQYYGGLVGIDG